MAQGHSMTVTLTCDHLEEDDGGAGIFSPARRTAGILLRLAKEERLSCEVEHLVGPFAGKEEPLAHLERSLFTEG